MKGTYIKSGNENKFQKGIPNINLSFLLIMPKLQILNLSQSNFLEMLTDEEIANLASRLK